MPCDTNRTSDPTSIGVGSLPLGVPDVAAALLRLLLLLLDALILGEQLRLRYLRRLAAADEAAACVAAEAAATLGLG